MSSLPSHIGPYEVIRLLGKGGMAIVYLGRDPAIDRWVAIKLLRESLDSPELRERFAREARLAGRLRHQNIVTIFQVGEHESAPYIVMEYIPGDSLADIIKRRPPVTVTWKLRIVEDVCRALAYAHKAGVIHRDMKPANIQIDPDGMVKILDFGIARIGEQKTGEQALTRLGMMMGTPNYMSPEQINPGTADHRSDVFAVGLVFYELLTSKRAFGGDSYAVLHSILHDSPEPVEKYCSDIDPEVVAILSRAIQKNPDARYQDLAEMRDDLKRVRTRLRAVSHDTSDEGPITVATPTYTEVEVTRVTDRTGEITRLLFDARDAYEAGEFAQACERCDRVLELDSANADAAALRARAAAHLAVAQARELLVAGQAALAAGRLEEAAEQIRKAEALSLPGEEGATVHAQVSALARAISAATERAKAVGERLARAREQLQRGDLDAAAQAIDEALALAPGHREALAVRSEVRVAVEQERVRQRAAEVAIVNARRLAERGDFALAITTLQQHRPEHPGVSAALADIIEQQAAAARQAADERRRQDYAAKAQSVVRAARAAAEQGDPAAALAQLDAIQFGAEDVTSAALDRLKPEVDALMARCEAAQHLDAARAALAHGDLDDAAKAIGRARERDRAHPDLETVAAATARATAIQEKVERAREQLRKRTLEAAATSIEEALALGPDSREAQAVRDDINAALAERERTRQRAAEGAVADARRHAARGDFARAITALQQHRPEHPAVTAALTELIEQQAAAEHQAADEQRREKYAVAAAAIVRTARAAAKRGDSAAALAQLDTIQFGAEDVTSAALERLKPEVDALMARCEAAQHLDAARAALAHGDLDDAAKAIERARERDRTHPDLETVATATARATAIQEKVERAREQLRKRTLEAAATSIEEALALAPDSREAQTVRDDINAALAERERARQRAAEGAVADARRHAARGDFARAITALQQHRPEHPAVTAALAELVEQRAAAEHRAADEKRREKYAVAAAAIVRTARAAAKRGDAAAALEQLQTIRFGAEDVTSAALDRLKPEVEALMARSEAAQHLDAARAALAAGHIKEAWEAVDRARARDNTHPGLDAVVAAFPSETILIPAPAATAAPPVDATILTSRPTAEPAQPQDPNEDTTVESDEGTPPISAWGPPTVVVTDVSPAFVTPATVAPAENRPTQAIEAPRPQLPPSTKPAGPSGVVWGGAVLAAAVVLATGVWWVRSDRGEDVTPTSVDANAGDTTGGPVATLPPPVTTPTAPSDRDAPVVVDSPTTPIDTGRQGAPPQTPPVTVPGRATPPGQTRPPGNAPAVPPTGPTAAERLAAERARALEAERARLEAAERARLEAAAERARLEAAERARLLAAERARTQGGSATSPGNLSPGAGTPPVITTTPDPPPPRTVTPPPPDPRLEAARDEAAIRSVLAQYTQGYQNRDAAAIRRVWPTAPASLQASLSAAKDYQVVLDGTQISLRGDTAEVTTRRRIRFQPLAGKVQETSVATKFSFRRSQGSWSIEGIQ